jgi:hypothetical protein
VQEDSGLRFSATKEEMVTTALDCRLAETREEVVDTLARSVLGGGVIDGSSSAAEFSDGFERSLLGYETSLRRLETEIGRVSAADAARRFDANWVSEIVTRIGSLAFIFFTVQYLGARYLHLARQGAFLDGCADGIELVCLEYEGEARRERLDRFVAGLLDREPTEEKVQSALDRLAEMAERVAVAATEAESRRGGDAEAGARTAAAPAPRRSWLARLAGRGRRLRPRGGAANDPIFMPCFVFRGYRIGCFACQAAMVPTMGGRS